MNGTLNDLPIVITSCGKYVTRYGKEVTINTIIDHSENYEVTMFNCKGHLHHKREGKKDKRQWTIWHESGRYMPVGEHDFDIVRAIGD